MANVSRIAGLVPVQYMNGAAWNGQARLYSIASDYGTALAIGDPVTLSGTADDNGVAGIVLATAGDDNPITGVIVGLGVTPYFGVNTDNLNSIIRPASVTEVWYALVVDDPAVIFEIQEDDTSTRLTKAAVGGNFNLASGANNGYVSGWQLNNTATNNAATHQVQIVGAPQRSNNTIGEQYAHWYVRINRHSYKAGTAGV